MTWKPTFRIAYSLFRKTTGFPSQRANNVEFWCCLCLSFWTNSGVAREMRRLNAHIDGLTQEKRCLCLSFWTNSGVAREMRRLNAHIDGLMQEKRNSIANALELHLSCTNRSIWVMSWRSTVNEDNWQFLVQSITKPGNNAATVPWPDPFDVTLMINAKFTWVYCRTVRATLTHQDVTPILSHLGIWYLLPHIMQ